MIATKSAPKFLPSPWGQYFPLVFGSDGRVMDMLLLQKLSHQCVIGIYPNERGRLQPVQLDLAVFLDPSYSGMARKLKDVLDYDRLVDEVKTHLSRSRFKLIEEAAETLCALFLKRCLTCLTLPKTWTA